MGKKSLKLGNKCRLYLNSADPYCSKFSFSARSVKEIQGIASSKTDYFNYSIKYSLLCYQFKMLKNLVFKKAKRVSDHIISVPLTPTFVNFLTFVSRTHVFKYCKFRN